MPIVKDYLWLIIKGVQHTKKQAFRQHVVDNQKLYAYILKQNLAPPPQPKGDTFTFTADQLIKFVATVAIQVAQPQVCYTNAPKNTIDKNSSLCRRVSEAAKSQLGISISGNTLFDAVGNVRAAVLPASKISAGKPEPFRLSASIKPFFTENIGQTSCEDSKNPSRTQKRKYCVLSDGQTYSIRSTRPKKIHR